MTRKVTKTSQTSVEHRKDNGGAVDLKGMPAINSQISPSAKTIKNLIQKEIVACAAYLEIDAWELQAWLDLHVSAPDKTILHLLRMVKKYHLDPLQDDVMLIQSEKNWHLSISIDTWINILNRHPSFEGITFTESPELKNELPIWMECTIYRKDRILPTTVREYFCEVSQTGEAWERMPRRMLRHRTLQQCARIAMGITLADPKENQYKNIEMHSEIQNHSSARDSSIRPTLDQKARLRQILQTPSMTS